MALISASVTRLGNLHESARDLVPAFAKFWRYRLHLERLVNLLFARAATILPPQQHKALLKGHVSFGCDFA
jgi:hypothetical protein